MPANRNQFAPLLAPGLAAIFFKNLKDRPSEYSRWLPTKTSRRAYEEEYKLAGLGQFIYKAEGAVYTFDEPIPGDTIRFTHLTYGLGFRVTEEMKEDDLYGIIAKMPKELARSSALNKEVLAHGIINNAFSSSYTGYDDTALCANAHPLLNGSTLDNLVTGDFSASALQTALELFEAFTDDRGYKVMVKPKYVLHGPSNIWEVNKVLKSEMEANTSDNNINVIRTQFGLDPMLSHYLTDADSWFVMADKGTISELNGARMYIRVNDQFRSDTDPLNGDELHMGRHRVSTGFGDFRWIVGSQGV